MSFKMPLKTRQHYADYRRNRYANDPAFRLRLVNQMRERTGRTPYASADEIPSYSEFRKRIAATRRRNADGTFA